ncbi:MAG: hypothetical protein ABIO06_09610 [Pseudolysinimonas sp.]
MSSRDTEQAQAAWQRSASAVHTDSSVTAVTVVLHAAASDLQAVVDESGRERQ